MRVAVHHFEGSAGPKPRSCPQQRALPTDNNSFTFFVDGLSVPGDTGQTDWDGYSYALGTQFTAL